MDTSPTRRAKVPLLLLLVTCALYVGYLVGDGFGDFERGDGTREFRPGYVAVRLQLFQTLPAVVLGLSGWIFMVVPILLGDVAFLALPILFFHGALAKPRVNRVMRLVFLCGGCAYAVLLWVGRFNPPEIGAYLWLLAAMTAVECLASHVPLATANPAGAPGTTS